MKFHSNVSGAKFGLFAKFHSKVSGAEFEFVDGPPNVELLAEICKYIQDTYKPTADQFNNITAILNDGLSGCDLSVTHRHPDGTLKNVGVSVKALSCLNLEDISLFFEMLNILSQFEIGIRINRDEVTNDTVDLFEHNKWWLEKRSFLEQMKSLKPPFRRYATATRFSASDIPKLTPIEID